MGGTNRAKPRGPLNQSPFAERADESADGKLAQQTAEQLQLAQAGGEKPQEPERALSDMEGGFMAALQKALGGAEMSEEAVRKAIMEMSPEQRAALAKEGSSLKREILTKPEYTEEQQVFRSEINERAEKAGLPVEKDGEHLGKKILAFMHTSSAAIPQLTLLSALASTPYLVRLALAEAQETAPKADKGDLVAIEGALMKLKVAGFTDEAEVASRVPFIRRNLLLLYCQLYQQGGKLEGVSLGESTVLALGDIVVKARRLLDMLFQYALGQRWVKATLAITELQTLLVNGLWDAQEDECRELMSTRMASNGLKLPKLKLSAMVEDVRAGEQVVIKFEVVRAHVYSEEEAARLVERDVAPEGEQAPQEPIEGWWVIGEAIRSKGASLKVGGDEALTDVTHNSLVARQPISAGLRTPTMAGEVTFAAPDSPGEYKVMLHVRSAGCVGVDTRRKVVFNVRPALKQRQLKETPASPSKVTAGLLEDMEPPPPLEEDAPPALTADA